MKETALHLTRRASFGVALAPFLGAAARSNSSSIVKGAPEGLWPVMLTPFKADKSIDWPALDALTNWYIANGAVGLFACCLSSEVYFLSEEERIAVAARVVKLAGKLPVIVSGMPGREPGAGAPFVNRMTDAGAAAVVLTVCQMADKQESDAVWQDRVATILSATGNTPLGLYEAPSPYKRLLTPETMRWAAKTGRFVFEKDTSCDINAIRAKLAVIGGTPMRVFNAHSPILLQAVQDGGHGFSGIAANAYPGLCARILRSRLSDPAQAEKIQQFVRVSEPVLNIKYPASAKVLARLAGIPIEPICRSKDVRFTAEETTRLETLRRDADAL